jgi:hypothetical protein
MALDDFPEFAHMDKTRVWVGKLSDPDPAIAYWHSKTPHERLRAAEFIRQVTYGYDPAATRLQRVLAVTQRTPR